MKRKFRFFILLFFSSIIFTVNSYSLDSTCSALMNKIIENPDSIDFQDVEYWHQYQPSIKIKRVWDEEKGEFLFHRDFNNNLEISTILDYEILNNHDLKIGDKILEINNKKVKDLDQNQISELIKDYNNGFYKNAADDENTNKKFKFKFLNKKNKIIELELGTNEFKEMSEATVDIVIKNVSNIDVKKNSFDGDVEIRTSWEMTKLYDIAKDYLIVKNDKDEKTGYWYCIFNEEEFEEMQIGQVFSEPFNAIKKNRSLISRSYEFVLGETYYTEEEVKNDEHEKYLEITLIEKGNFTFSNKYNLKAFPFDKQILKIQIIDLSRSLDWLLTETTNWTYWRLKDYADKGEIIEWDIEKAYAKYFNVKDPIYESYAIGAEINLEIQRNFQYYIFKVISPIILILLVCWSVFWIHPKELESKLTITIICLLSLIAYNFVIDEDLPKLSYLTIIDYIILLSYLFATVPNFLSIYSYQKWMKKKSQWKIVDAKSRIYGPILYLTLVFLIIFINSVNNPNTAAFLGFLS